jgi:hypothetical protein
MSGVDKEKTRRQLQQNYHTMSCPICLENSDDVLWDEMGDASPGGNNNTVSQSGSTMKCVGS